MYSHQPSAPHLANGMAAPPAPPANAGWAVASLIFFWPLAFAAFTHSSRVYPLWASGDYVGARYASDRARRLGKIALFIWPAILLVMIVFNVVIFASVMSSSSY